MDRLIADWHIVLLSVGDILKDTLREDGAAALLRRHSVSHDICHLTVDTVFPPSLFLMLNVSVLSAFRTALQGLKRIFRNGTIWCI